MTMETLTQQWNETNEICDYDISANYLYCDVSNGEPQREYYYRRQYLEFYRKPSDEEYILSIAEEEIFKDLTNRSSKVFKIFEKSLNHICDVYSNDNDYTTLKEHYTTFNTTFKDTITSGLLWLTSGSEEDKNELFILVLNNYSYFELYNHVVLETHKFIQTPKDIQVLSSLTQSFQKLLTQTDQN